MTDVQSLKFIHYAISHEDQQKVAYSMTPQTGHMYMNNWIYLESGTKIYTWQSRVHNSYKHVYQQHPFHLTSLDSHQWKFGCQLYFLLLLCFVFFMNLKSAFSICSLLVILYSFSTINVSCLKQKSPIQLALFPFAFLSLGFWFFAQRKHEITQTNAMTHFSISTLI